MIEIGKSIVKDKSKYIKESREKAIFYRCSILYIFALYVLPPYFGLPTPGFDMTALRIMMIAMLAMIFADQERSRQFVLMIKYEKISIILAFYTFVLIYTMVFRKNFNSFFNPFMELLQMYLLLYAIRDCIGVDKTIKYIIGYIYLLVILGFIEYVIQETPFVLLNTINKGTLYSGVFIRNGNYRIMSNCGHSLGYGLLLMTALPFAGIDVDKHEYNFLKRPFLLGCIIGNIFLTGSRSTLGVMMVELFLMFILSDKKYLKVNILICISFVIAFILVVLCTQSTSFGRYVMLQITSLIDTVFGTKFSLKYGAELGGLIDSSSYRNLLWKIFGIRWLNPLLGIGKGNTFSTIIDGVVIASIDNFYVVEYLTYAYPGFISYVLFLLYFLFGMFIKMIRTKSAIVRMLFIGTVGYYIHLSIVDSLMTLKYVYILFAIFLSLNLPENIKGATCKYLGKRKSMYVRK